MTTKIYPCPKCGRRMHRDGRTPGGTPRWTCRSGSRVEGRKYCYGTTNPTGEAPRKQDGRTGSKRKAPRFARKLAGIERFVVTCAQNATPVNKPFLASLRTYCRINKAELIVIPTRYKNPTSAWTASQANMEVWDPLLAPHLYNQRRRLGSSLILLGDIKVQPTARQPLTGFEGITHGESGIIGHTKLQLRVIPTPQGKLPKIMTTTGAVTVPNYTDSRAGALGKFHHVYGAIVVEARGKTFHMRQINATGDGTFIDLDKWYGPGGSTTAPAALALVLGDTHQRFQDPAVERATFGEQGIVDRLRPQTLVFHDLLDMHSRNPHHRGNVFAEIAKRDSGLHDVATEVIAAIKWLNKIAKLAEKVIVVPSNHDNMLFRWIRDTDWRNDPDNAEFYLTTAIAMVRQTKMTASGHETVDPFIHWLQQLAATNVTALLPDQSYMLGGGIELGLHGDRGPNGSRGSARNLKNVGVKTIIGHSHTPGIEDGCYQTGTSTPLRLEYNQGPSSWLNTHCIVYANGKRSLINIIDGEWGLPQ